MLTERISDSYHSNYHAWSHRMWCFLNLAPTVSKNNNSSEDKDRLLEYIPYTTIQDILKSNVYKIYSKEFENNFNFISTHVSDHSGMHFRQFLMLTLMSHFERKCIVRCMSSDDVDLETTDLFCENVKRVITMYFEDSDVKNRSSTCLTNYISFQDRNVNLFDIQIHFIISELNSNLKLSTMFVNHEALWYYRRFLIFKFKNTLNSFRDFKCCDESNLKLTNHQDSNGVSHIKDAKFDFTLKYSYTWMNPVLDNFLQILFHKEKNIIENTCNNTENNVNNVCCRYKVWLKQFFKLDEKFLK